MLKFVDKKNSNKTFTNSWKVLIVDDEEQIHLVTKSVLDKFEFRDKGLEFFSAYSGKEAVEILRLNDDIDLILLDVVMESDDAGLKIVKIIREELQNKKVRIVLRTGQSGSAPEREVILNYDIDDYKEKTELTSTKLFTTLVSAFRTSEYLKALDKNRKALEIIIKSSTSIFKVNSLNEFAQNSLKHLSSFLEIINENRKVENYFFVSLKDGKYSIIASSDKESRLTEEIINYLKISTENSIYNFQENIYIRSFKSINQNQIFLFIDGCKELCKEDKHLLNIFSNNISTAFDNLCLNDEVRDTQADLIERLGEVVESRSKETAYHVNRVATISYIIALAYGLSEEESLKIKLASPMHDIGKIGIPDNILLKPGKLTDDEYKIMKTHTSIGKDILDGSSRELLLIAKNIAYEHHERWNGSGYPKGLEKYEIKICARIVSLADVFDALINKRVYKEAWEIDKVLAYLKMQSGLQFEPKLVELFFENIELIQNEMYKINKK